MKEFKGHKKEILVKCTLSQSRNYHSKDMANQIKFYNVRTRVQVVRGKCKRQYIAKVKKYKGEVTYQRISDLY